MAARAGSGRTGGRERVFGRKKTMEQRPKTPYTVRCPFGCTRLDCATMYEAEVFRRRMQRCPQCGGELSILSEAQQEKS